MKSRLYNKITLSNNETIHYQEANPQSEEHLSIILIHGNKSTQVWWDDIIDGLQPLGYRIIAMDLRGFGQSTYHTPCNRFKDWAEDVIELCKLLKIEKVIVNGWSFGGTIAQKMAQLAPELVVKLILTASVSHEGLHLFNEKEEQIHEREDVANHKRVATTLKMIETNNKEEMKYYFQTMLYGKMQNYPPEKKTKLQECPFLQKCHLDLFYSIVNPDIQIDKIKSKTLLLHGDQDLVIPMKTIMKTAEKLGKLEVWEKGGHMLPLENTARYLESITKFIKQ